MSHKTNPTRKRLNLAALAAVVIIAAAPLLLLRNSDTDFEGSDAEAVAEAQRLDPDLDPWESPLWSPPGGETESLLFALQAAIGAGVLGYVAGALRTRHQLTSHAEDHPGAAESAAETGAKPETGAEATIDLTEQATEPSTAVDS